MDAPLRLLLTNAAAAGTIALVAWVASRVTKRQAVVHGLWLLALARLVTPPIAPLPVLPTGPLPALSFAAPTPTVALMPPPAGPAAGSTRAVPARLLRRTGPAPVSRAPVSRAASPRLDWRMAAVLALAAGAIGILALTAWRFARFGRLLAVARPAPAALARRAAGLAERIGLGWTPEVLLVPARIPPMLWPGASGPRVLLAADLLLQLTADELDAILAHELAHVRRRDHWVRLVEVAATALFWWYPVTWWARGALRRAEERCCDEWVLRVLPRSAQAYASGLLKSLTFVAAPPASLPAVASGAGPVHDLEARLKEILMTRPAPVLAVPSRVALAAVAILGLAIFPTRADSTLTPAATPAATRSSTTDTPAPAPVAKPAPPPVAKPALAPLSTPVPAPLARPAAVPRPALAPSAGLTPLPAMAPRAVVAGDGPDEDPALAAERRALEDQRRKLHEQELQLERQSIALEARAEQAQLRAEATRLRAEGDVEQAARVEKQSQLVAQRTGLQERQLQLEMEHARLEAEMDRTSDAEAQDPAREELEKKQQALEAEMEKADQQVQALEAEQRVHELRGSTDDLARSLAEQIESLKEAAAEAPAQKAEIEHEIQRLTSALDALQSGATPRSLPRRTPRAQP